MCHVCLLSGVFCLFFCRFFTSVLFLLSAVYCLFSALCRLLAPLSSTVRVHCRCVLFFRPPPPSPPSIPPSLLQPRINCSYCARPRRHLLRCRPTLVLSSVAATYKLIKKKKKCCYCKKGLEDSKQYRFRFRPLLEAGGGGEGSGSGGAWSPASALASPAVLNAFLRSQVPGELVGKGKEVVSRTVLAGKIVGEMGGKGVLVC